MLALLGAAAAITVLVVTESSRAVHVSANGLGVIAGGLGTCHTRPQPVSVAAAATIVAATSGT